MNESQVMSSPSFTRVHNPQKGLATKAKARRVLNQAQPRPLGHTSSSPHLVGADERLPSSLDSCVRKPLEQIYEAHDTEPQWGATKASPDRIHESTTLHFRSTSDEPFPPRTGRAHRPGLRQSETKLTVWSRSRFALLDNPYKEVQRTETSNGRTCDSLVATALLACIESLASDNPCSRRSLVRHRRRSPPLAALCFDAEAGRTGVEYPLAASTSLSCAVVGLRSLNLAQSRCAMIR